MNTALIIVDIQYAFVKPDSVLVDKILDFVNKGSFSLVIGTRYVNSTKTACYRFEGWTKCMEGTKDADIIKSIDDACDFTVSKDKYSCWNEHLLKILKMYNIDRIVFCGVNTGCCVLASAFDSYNDLWDTIVIEDLCDSTSGKKSHEAGIQILRECITKNRVITSEQYLG